MIIAPTPCYFVVKGEGEVASHIVAEVSPKTSSDIATAVLVSSDFDSDITAVNYMDQAAASITAATHIADAETVVRYNPLYIPGPIERIDELLQHDGRGDAIRFVGMSGNPYLLKVVEVKGSRDEQALLSAKVEYRPFDIPGYSEIVESNASLHLN